MDKSQMQHHVTARTFGAIPYFWGERLGGNRLGGSPRRFPNSQQDILIVNVWN